MRIDWDRVQELKDEIGEDDFSDIVEIFLAEVDEKIDGLRNGLDVSELEASLHFLKGSALNLGFEEFSSLCQRGESSASQSDYDSIDLNVILTSYSESKTEFIAQM